MATEDTRRHRPSPSFPESIERSRARLAAIVESSEDAIISKDLNGVIITWNAAAERLFGYTADEVIGRPVTILIPADRHDEEPNILARVRRGERIEHYETVRRRKDGTLLDLSLTVSPILDLDGTVIGASKIARDITDRKRIEAQREELLRAVKQARAEAEEANRGKDEFLAMLGHNLRNPLSAVRNAITVATLDRTNQDRALVIARRQTDQLARIVDDLLDVARITRGRIPLQKQHVSLIEIVTRAADGARPLMDERGHSLTISGPPEPVYVDVDAARIEQAIANLLVNAAKYTEQGGAIDVRVERSGVHALIRVSDNGVGMAPDVLPKVFDLFVQGRRSIDRAEGGLGVGLTVVRRIIELHGGTVEAASAGLGRGSEFVIRLATIPMDEQRVALNPKDIAAVRSRSSARVLIVEDNVDAAETLLMILEILGHHVRVVNDPILALEAARANQPDIVIIDIGLPGMNGYDLARQFRSQKEFRHVVLVALTGYGRPEDKAQAMAAGFDYHLVKPVDMSALGDLIARFEPAARDGRPHAEM